jgi:NADPH:quinone reductase-like Zn-dependent oxidoreductase/SAM-dependent methyltransferase/acyl carrier protein
MHAQASKAAPTANGIVSMPGWVSGIQSRCPLRIAHEDVYGRFASVGLNYSNLFTSISTLAQGDNESFASIDVSAIKAEAARSACDGKTPMLCHPALMDCCFQVLLGTIRYLYVPFVPTHIARIEWCLAGGATLPDRITVFARSRVEPSGTLCGDVLICTEEGTQVLGVVEGMECTSLGRSSAEQPSFVATWQTWENSSDIPHSTAEQWQHAFSGFSGALLSRRPEVELLLSNVCLAYMHDFFVSNQSHIKPLVPTPAWATHRTRYWQWCLDKVAEANKSNVNLESALAAVNSMPDASDWRLELAAVTRIGSNLRALLSDPFAVGRILFADGDRFMTDLYAQAATFQPFVDVCAQQVVAAIRAAPDRVITILELGAGTGALTARIFDSLFEGQTPEAAAQLSARLRYIYTDVSMKFIQDARPRLASYSFIDYRVFDIERSPSSQGVDLHTVDIVLGFDVLHVASDLSAGLSNVHAMLVPGGSLCLIELTRPWLWTCMFFGLFSGWWSMADERQQVTQTQQQWTDRLSKTGFNGIRMEDERSEQDRKERMQEFCHSIITARTPSVDMVRASPVPVSASSSSAFLSLPPPSPSVRPLTLFDATVASNDLDRLLAVAIEIISANQPCEIHIITQGGQNMLNQEYEEVDPTHAAIIGFARVLGNEYPFLVRLLLLDFDSVCTGADRFAWLSCVRGLSHDTTESEYAVRRGQLLVPKFKAVGQETEERVAAKQADFMDVTAAYRLEVGTVGELGTLRYRRFTPPALGPNDVLVRVHAAALNFKDLMLALGMLTNPMGLDAESLAFNPPSAQMGLEFSGVVVAVGSAVADLSVGCSVFGLGANCFASHVVTAQHLVAKKPEHLTHTAAVSMPIVFTTVYSGLIDKARISAGETVLVHSAAGGIGQAAIQLCQHVGAKVIATVGSEAKRDYLKCVYGVNTFADSHSNQAWKQDVATLTGGRGVDVVLNSLKGDAIPLGLQSLNVGGRFVEIGKVDILANSPLSMGLLLNDVSLFSVQLDVMMQSNPDRMGRYLQAVAQLAQAKAIRPIVDKVFAAQRAEEAFRYIMAGQHKGKIILDFSKEAMQADNTQIMLSPHSRLFHSDCVYVLTGGCGAVALQVVHWMSSQGGRQFLLLSRRGRAALRPSEAAKLDALKAFGVNIAVEAADICDADSVSAAYARSVSTHGFPSLSFSSTRFGLLHLAMVLDDAIIPQLTPARMLTAVACKLQGALNLVHAFPIKQVDCVVFFSSAASALGNPSQANYAAGNAFLDSYAHCLQSAHPHLRARVLNLGVVEDVGVLAEDYKLKQLLTAKGFAGGLTSAGVCKLLKRMMQSEREQVQLLHGAFDWRQIIEQYPNMRARFAHLVDHRSEDRNASSGSASSDGTFTIELLTAHMSQVLGVASAKLDPTDALTLQGLDSLLAVELSATLNRKFGVRISQMELLGGASMQDIVNRAEAM